MEENRIRLTLKNGFECEFEKDATDNVDVFEIFVEQQKPETTPVDKTWMNRSILNLILGEEQAAAFKEYLVKTYGRAKMSDYSNSLDEVYRAIGENKKK